MTLTDRTPLRPADTLRLLRASRLARIAFTVDGEPFVVPAKVVVDPGGRIVFRTDDDHALGHLDGRHVAVEVDGRSVTPGTSWYVIVRGVATEVDENTDIASGHHFPPVDAWAPERPDRRFVVVPSVMTGRLVGHAEADNWFAGVPAS